MQRSSGSVSHRKHRVAGKPHWGKGPHNVPRFQLLMEEWRRNREAKEKADRYSEPMFNSIQEAMAWQRKTRFGMKR